MRQRTKLETKAAAIAACRDSSGQIRPKAVWQAARDPSSPLHGEFEWDLGKAAEEAWEIRARELIREVKFIVEVNDIRTLVPMYVHDPRATDSSYLQTLKVAKNGSLSKKVLQEELLRIKGAINRAIKLAAAFGLTSSFEQMLAEVVDIENSLGSDDEAPAASH